MRKLLVLLMLLGLLGCASGGMKAHRHAGPNEKAYVEYGNWFDKKHGAIANSNPCFKAFVTAIKTCRATVYNREGYFGCILLKLVEADECLEDWVSKGNV